MRMPKGPIHKEYGEHIVVLRKIDVALQDDSITDDYTFCKCKYPKKAFDIIIDESENQKMSIFWQSDTWDETGIATSDIYYRGYIIPPNNLLEIGDLVLRLEKNCEELYIEFAPQRVNRQRCQLVNRAKTESFQHQD